MDLRAFAHNGPSRCPWREHPLPPHRQTPRLEPAEVRRACGGSRIASKGPTLPTADIRASQKGRGSIVISWALGKTVIGSAGESRTVPRICAVVPLFKQARPPVIPRFVGLSPWNCPDFREIPASAPVNCKCPRHFDSKRLSISGAGGASGSENSTLSVPICANSNRMTMNTTRPGG